MKVAAVGDIHAPNYLELFRKSLKEFLKTTEDVAAFLLAGDIIDSGRYEQLDQIRELIDKVHLPIYSCFGNNEYKEYINTVKEKLPSVQFLDDSYITFRIGNKTVSLIGSRGVLDKPTYWQKKTWPNIENIYESRRLKLNELADVCRADLKILLIHYPPTLKIVEGENKSFVNQMGSNHLESLIKKFNLVITAHAHKGKKSVQIEGTPVVNVSLPLRNGICILDVESKFGLDKFT